MLTPETYFTKDNKYVSNSKLTWFEKDKAKFKEFFIDGKYEDKKTDSLIIGNAIDIWLTQGRQAFDDTFKLVAKRNRKSDTFWEHQLNESQYNQIKGMCETVEKQTFYQELHDFTTQKLLFYNMPVGEYFKGICGILDFVKIKKNKAYIVDLKSTGADFSPDTYHFKCLKYNYYRQLAMYSLLIEKNYGITDIECRHMVVVNDYLHDGLFPVYNFLMSEDRIEEGRWQIDGLITDLKNEVDFKPRDIGWDDYITL